ncbi:type II secretion system protein [Desulfonatronovibrio magnus]|uniref:type II secretion system protein n=1 Tax=Desulfonatronovibrio magnus TaxID=698827 RepID=UPI000698E6EA|nr:prepilin-type N-terminal cleavage/methylation domain-containing protein [Desulfonatronovibrio magnus]
MIKCFNRNYSHLFYAFREARRRDKSHAAGKAMGRQSDYKSVSLGMTLIEIAIVLVVIGLVLGMFLKGRELVVSARVKNAYASYNKIVSAMYTFYDRYGFFPGDGCDAQETDPINCTNSRDGIVAGDETSSFFSLLISVGFLTSRDKKNPLGDEWNAGGSEGEATWLYIPNADLRLVCELDRMADDGLSGEGFIRAGSNDPESEFDGADTYDVTSQDCRDLSGTAAVQIRILP